MKVKSIIPTLRDIDFWIVSPTEWALASGYVDAQGNATGDISKVKNKKVDYAETVVISGKVTMYIYIK